MKWFYALGNDQKGPVNSTQLRALAGSGVIGQASLVWHEGMPQWQPYASVAAEVESTMDEATEGAAGDMEVCAYSGEVHARGEMLQYGDHWVAVPHKEAFVASLQQGKEMVAGERMSAMVYVGFWWRVLASTVDFFVKMVPSLIFNIPSYIVQGKQAYDMAEAGGNPTEMVEGFNQMTPLIIGLSILAFVASVAFSMAYETWMVGKYGGTLGKLVCGFRVVRADGAQLSYMAAFGRWWGETLTKFITVVVGYGAMAIGFIGILGVGIAASGGGDAASGAGAAGAIAGMLAVVILGFVLGGFGYWMAAFSKEKKTLHDIMCNTRVVRKM